MKLVKAWEEKGVEVPAPFQRTIKVFFAPDKGGVDAINFSHALIPPQGRTDYHSHDRPELIYIVSGNGMCAHDGEETPITADMIMWVLAGEKHQIINTGYELLKLATVFVPGYNAADLTRRCVEAARAAEK
jgi:mannose-6-phosphate isomerase-like protein (cupin superfamily)